MTLDNGPRTDQAMSAVPLVLLAAPPGAPADALRSALTAAGLRVADVTGPPLPDLAPASAVVVCAGLGFVRLLRAELGDHILPVIWVAPDPEALAAGMGAGGDAGMAL